MTEPRSDASGVTRLRAGSADFELPLDAISAQPFWLNAAVNGLRRARPEFSAAEPMAPWLKWLLMAAVLLVPIVIATAPQAALDGALAAFAVPFFCMTLVRLYALWSFVRTRDLAPEDWAPDVSPVPDVLEVGGELPSYSILVALYREASVAPALVRAMAALQYPPDKLEIVFITEANDDETRAALNANGLAAYMHVLTVPEGDPQTKPRALSYALALVSGDMIAVYDAEDIPEPDQLLRAVAAFQSSSEPLACIQARLNVYNGAVSPISRQFAMEYTALYDAILPALAKLGLPLPLGGTSNHFRRSELEAAGGWDPFNVTEDADLGIRFARLGMGVGVIGSTTWEEAPVTMRGWLGQRTRWLKGWMQTYLVHMRQPLRLFRELGLKRFLGFQILMPGMIFSALGHLPFFGVAAASWYFGTLFLPSHSGFAEACWMLGFFNLAASYASAIALAIVTCRRRGQGHHVLSSILIPVYWLVISLAAWRAVLELCWSPYHWEKTAHSARPVTIGLATP